MLRDLCAECKKQVSQLTKPKNSIKWLCEDCLEEHEGDTI